MVMRPYIDVNVEDMPYSQPILLENKVFIFTFYYNEISKQFSCDVADTSNKTIRAGEVLVLNQPLWRGIPDYNLPMVSIIPMDESKQETEINLGNFGKTVKLYIDDRKEVT